MHQNCHLNIPISLCLLQLLQILQTDLGCDSLYLPVSSDLRMAVCPIIPLHDLKLEVLDFTFQRKDLFLLQK